MVHLKNLESTDSTPHIGTPCSANCVLYSVRFSGVIQHAYAKQGLSNLDHEGLKLPVTSEEPSQHDVEKVNLSKDFMVYYGSLWENSNHPNSLWTLHLQTFIITKCTYEPSRETVLYPGQVSLKSNE